MFISKMDSSDIKSYLFNCQLKKRWLHNIVYCICIAITALKCEIVASSLKILNLQEIPITMQTVELGIICSDSCSPSSKINKLRVPRQYYKPRKPAVFINRMLLQHCAISTCCFQYLLDALRVIQHYSDRGRPYPV